MNHAKVAEIIPELMAPSMKMIRAIESNLMVEYAMFGFIWGASEALVDAEGGHEIDVYQVVKEAYRHIGVSDQEAISHAAKSAKLINDDDPVFMGAIKIGKETVAAHKRGSDAMSTGFAHFVAGLDQLMEKRKSQIRSGEALSSRSPPKNQSRNSFASAFEKFIGFVRISIGIAVVGFLGYAFLFHSGGKESRLPKPQVVFNEPVQQFPSSGHVEWYMNKRGEAPLEVQTQIGNNYYLKVTDADTKRDVLGMYIRGGNTENVGLSSGRYIIKYASGSAWYGKQHYFGPNTGYSEASKVFNFSDNAYEVSGYTVTLYTVVNGNLGTKRLSKGQF